MSLIALGVMAVNAALMANGVETMPRMWAKRGLSIANLGGIDWWHEWLWYWRRSWPSCCSDTRDSPSSHKSVKEEIHQYSTKKQPSETTVIKTNTNSLYKRLFFNLHNL